MTFKAVIESSKLKHFTSSVCIYNEKDKFINRYYVTEIEDKRTNFSMKDILKFVDEEDQRLRNDINYADKTMRILARTIKLSEEVGELSDEVLSSLGLQRKEKVNEYTKEKLEDEFADVLFITLLLAKVMDVDIMKASERKGKKVERYHEQNNSNNI